MNPAHYPSFELCKKLTEIGFPDTEKVYFHGEYFPDYMHDSHDGTFQYVCPSVMEMLDVMPRLINEESLTIIQATCNSEQDNGTIVEYIGLHVTHSNTPPNALAEMILWLHENNFISFIR